MLGSERVRRQHTKHSGETRALVSASTALLHAKALMACQTVRECLRHGTRLLFRLCRARRVDDRRPDVLDGVMADPARAIQSAAARQRSEPAARALQELH